MSEAQQTKRETQVTEEMERLHTEIESTKEALSSLFDRLQPVLSSNEDLAVALEDVKEQERSAPLAQDLQRCVISLCELRQKINVVRDRVEV